VNPRQLYGWTGEVALIVLTVVVTVGMERLFVDNSFLRDALALGIASHLVAIAARRAGLGMAASGLLSLAAAVVTLTVLLYADTANVILPSGETFDLVREDLSEGWTVFTEESAPVPVIPGFILAIGVLLWVSAFLADWAAFRLRSPIEAIAPSVAIFVFTALLGTEGDQVLHGTLFGAAVALTLLTIRVNRQAREEVWIEPTAGRGPGATLRLGTLAGSVAVLSGAIFGPLLPGAGDPGLVDVTELDNGPNTRVVISPLVEVQAKIVEQSRFELFSVEVDEDQRDYWRLMALDEFDGQLWKASSNFDPAAGRVDTTLDPSVPTRSVRQTVTTTGDLGNIYLPVAYELAQVVDSGNIALEYEVESAALVVTRESDAEIDNGISYTVESAVPIRDGPLLRRSSTADLDSGFRDHYTQLPRDFPDSIRAEAESITTGATTDYDRALALQSHLRDFTYNINVALEHNVNDLETFLFEVQQGYCVQFASAFASMARSIGLPTRMAVGFTWGEWNETRGAYVVRGEHAHAWPEVYFEGVGWVNFEPTPGRGNPNDTAVTGVAGAQAGEEDPTPSTTSIPSGVIAEADPRLNPALQGEGDLPTTTLAGPAAGGGGSLPLTEILLVLAAIGVVAAIAPSVKLMQRRARAAKVAHDPKGRVEFAWDEALDALALIDIRHHPQETPSEFAARIDRRRRDLTPVSVLAESATEARYSPVIDDSVVRAAETSAREITTACRHSSTKSRRAAALLDPRPLVKR
jgi:transglutaminase-like putative cysteine protease